jgi:hypothetical protein
MQSHRSFVVCLLACLWASAPLAVGESPFAFSGPPPLAVHENYLARAAMASGFCEANDETTFPPMEERLRLVRVTGAKFLGRATSSGAWTFGHQDEDAYFAGVAEHIRRFHAQDPDLVIQGCVFETTWEAVDNIAIPPWVFDAFKEPVETRNFRYQEMIFTNGRFLCEWGTKRKQLGDGSVPDITRPETRRWIYYRARRMIDAGCEALHLGQMVRMTAASDRNYKHLDAVLTMVRAHAAAIARRKWVFLDAHNMDHTPKVGERLLFDHGSNVVRMAAVKDQPLQMVFQPGLGLIGRTKGGILPAGHRVKRQPYFLEFDNGGRLSEQGKDEGKWHRAGATGCWGFQEIDWFGHLSNRERNGYLRYIWEWLRVNDPAGHSEMPLSRPFSGMRGEYRHFIASDPEHWAKGFGTEATMAELYARDWRNWKPTAEPQPPEPSGKPIPPGTATE